MQKSESKKEIYLYSGTFEVMSMIATCSVSTFLHMHRDCGSFTHILLPLLRQYKHRGSDIYSDWFMTLCDMFDSI